MCKTCPHAQPAATSLWFNHIWSLYELQKGGYPFEKEDLNLDEWRALAELKTAMDMPPEITGQ